MTEQNVANMNFKQWNAFVPGYIYKMFKTSLCRYKKKITLMTLDTILRREVHLPQSQNYDLN